MALLISYNIMTHLFFSEYISSFVQKHYLLLLIISMTVSGHITRNYVFDLFVVALQQKKYNHQTLFTGITLFLSGYGTLQAQSQNTINYMET